MVKYIIRLDDACQTYNISNWLAIEKLLDQYSIKPIVGVIPFNEDRELFYSKKDENFWETIIRWQSKGWTIALHGYNHKCFALKKGTKQFLPLNNISEFAGLSINEQKEKLNKSLKIFYNNGVFPSIFMAPCHSFDEVTLLSLRSVSNINFISDGFSFRPYERYGFKWIPQQLWKFKLMPFGTWTICLHPNTMNLENIKCLSKVLNKHSNKFIDPRKILSDSKFIRYGVCDFLFNNVFKFFFSLKRINQNIKKYLSW